MRLLIYSLMLGTGLLGGWFLSKTPPPVCATPLHLSTHRESVPGEASASPVDPVGPGGTAPAANIFDWRQVESPDYRQYIVNLRSIGCPEETISDIVMADVAKLYDERIRETRARVGPYPYWRTDAGTNWTAELCVAVESLRAEQSRVLKELLGKSGDTPKIEGDTSDPRLDFMAPSLQRRVAEVQRQYDQRLANLLAGIDSSAESDDPLGDLRQAREAALDELLSSEAREEYELRVSGTADALRAALADLTVSETEFREIFRLQRRFQKEYPEDPFAFLDSEGSRAREQAEALLRKSYREVLGADRYAKVRFGK